MAKILCLLFVCFAAALADSYVDYSTSELDEDMIRSLDIDIRRAKEEMSTIQDMTSDDEAPRTNFFNNMKDKIRDKCKCDTHKECACCVDKNIKIPIVGTYKFQICSTISIEPENKLLKFKIHLGPLNLMQKKVSYVKVEEVCKKIEKFKRVEFCMKMNVEESEEKGLTGCLSIQVNILKIFNKPFYLPCVNFKNERLTMDQTMDDYKDDGVRVNLKALWKRVKNLRKKEKKE
uniref:Venom protein family 2 protein 4 n=1 Tax=Lethocerus distinctifemur TaxID=280095 RepID=A0A2K8JNM0_9HEMI|nr:venom protein family 2 protein 4 [Lethocerus distinctifemur]